MACTQDSGPWTGLDISYGLFPSKVLPLKPSCSWPGAGAKDISVPGMERG